MPRLPQTPGMPTPCPTPAPVPQGQPQKTWQSQRAYHAGAPVPVPPPTAAPAPDPVKQAADRIGEALKGNPGLSGQIFRDAATGATGIDAGGREIVDAMNRGSGGLTPEQQGKAVDTYAARPDGTHTVHKGNMDGGEAITIEPKKAVKLAERAFV